MLMLCLCGQSFAAPTTFAAPHLTSTPPKDEYLARAGVSLVRLLVRYTSSGAQANNSLACTGLGVLVGSWNTSSTTEFNTAILTDGNLFNTQHAANCVSGPPLTRSVESVQIFFSNLYNPENVSTFRLKKNDFSTKCLDEKNCGNGPALLSFHYAVPLPFLQLAQNSTTLQGFRLALTNTQGATSPPNTVPAADLVDVLGSFVTPQGNPDTNSNFHPESGSPEVTPQGLLLSLHLSNGQDMNASGLSPFLQGAQILSHPETDLQKNWRTGVINYYEASGNRSTAKQSFQLAAQENTQFQAPTDFVTSLSASNSNRNGGKTPTSSPASRPSQIFSAFPRWLLIVVVFFMLLLLGFWIRLIAPGLRYRREIRIAEQQSHVDTQGVSKLEASPWPALHPSTVVTDALPKGDSRCPRCHNLNPVDAKYCRHCSLPLSPSRPNPNVSVKSNAAPLPVTQPSVALPTSLSMQKAPDSPKIVKPSEPEKKLVLSEQKPAQTVHENIAGNIPPIVSPPVKVVHPQISPPVRAKQEQKEGGGERKGKRLGNYRLLHLLGTGAFADVYLGEHVFLKTQAAIKVLHKRLTQRELVRFVEESRTIASLRHAHIIRVLEFGLDGHEIDLEQSVFEVEGSIPYLVMDYAPGGTLRIRHPKGTRLPLETALPYITQIADALYYAHSKRVIHRDVKPENILVGDQDQVLLSDFGIFVMSHSEQSIHTQDMAGTVPYMAPEQIRGKPRPASDQYALAVVLYEWLCGVQPFRGESQWDIMDQHMNRPPASPREKVPSLSPEIEAVVLKALSKDPQDRFINIQAFAKALEEAFHHP